jgi:GTP cyclohydrolase I
MIIANKIATTIVKIITRADKFCMLITWTKRPKNDLTVDGMKGKFARRNNLDIGAVKSSKIIRNKLPFL